MNIGKKDSCYALSVVDKFVKKRRRAEEKQFENLYSPLKCNYDTMDEDDNNGMAAVLSAYGAVITTASRRHGRSRRSAIDREQQKETFPLRNGNTGASLTSWGEGASLALVGHPSGDGVTIKMLYGVNVLHLPASHPIFSYWLKLNLNELWLYYQKHVNQIILNRTTLSSLALPIFEAFVRILLIPNLSLNQTLLTFLLCVRQTWMTQFILAISP